MQYDNIGDPKGDISDQGSFSFLSLMPPQCVSDRVGRYTQDSTNHPLGDL